MLLPVPIVPVVQPLSFDLASRRSGQVLRPKLFEGVEPIEVSVTVKSANRTVTCVFEAPRETLWFVDTQLEGWFIWPEPSSTLHALRRLKDSNPSRQRKLVLEGVPAIPSLMLNAAHHRREVGKSLPDPGKWGQT
jgi:hypothetical protein